MGKSFRLLGVTLATFALCSCGGGESEIEGENATAATVELEDDVALAATEQIASTAAAEAVPLRWLTNGGFERGNYSGWTVEIPKGISEFGGIERPAGIVEVLRSFTFTPFFGERTTRWPRSGSYFLTVSTADEKLIGDLTYDTTVSQMLFLRKGDVIRGASFYHNGDFAAQDSVWVRVYDRTGKRLLATPWIEFSGNVQETDHNSVPYTHASNWKVWHWRAPQAGSYRLKLGATTHGDAFFRTSGFHDGIAVIQAEQNAALPITVPRLSPLTERQPVKRHDMDFFVPNEPPQR